MAELTDSQKEQITNLRAKKWAWHTIATLLHIDSKRIKAWHDTAYGTTNYTNKLKGMKFAHIKHHSDGV